MSQPLARHNPEPIWSPDEGRMYRYRLCRMDIPLEASRNRGTVNFIMLNPSSATAECNDPTVRNCERLARNWGYGNLVVTNLFAYRSPDRCRLGVVEDPVGPDNDWRLVDAAREAGLRVAAWGSEFCLLQDRAIWLRVRLHAERLDLMCLRRNKDSHPTHPGRISPADHPFESLEAYDLAPNLVAFLAPLRH